MKKNNGQDSEDLFQEIMEKAYGKNVFIEKFTDTKMVKGANKLGFVKSAPADFIVTAMGVMSYSEVKSCSDPVSFSLSQFTKSQLIAMRRQKAAGGLYLVYIHSLHTNTWYEVEGATLLQLAEVVKRKSIKWTDLGDYKWEL